MQLDNSFGLGQEQRQQLALNAGVLQSLEILRVPLQELNELVTQSIYENPLLEINTDTETSSEDFSPVPLSELAEEAPPPEERHESAPLDVQVRDIWRVSEGGGEGFDPGTLSGGFEPSFTEMLLEQIGALRLDDGFAELCRYLVACLDRKGYLGEEPADIAAELDCSLFDVMQALYLLQDLQPVGVGARSLEECLVLQLVQSNHFTPETIKLVKEGLPLLAVNDLPAIAKLLGTSREAAREVAAIVRGLHPIPSQGYDTGEKDLSIIPDAVIRREGEGYTVVLNDSTVPRLVLSREYSEMLSSTRDGEAKGYLQEKMGEARQLIKAVENREKTIVRILRQVIALQPKFFDDGLTLVPMSMAQVAEALELSASTISRAVQGKYIICAAGTVELKTLFSQGVQNKQGETLSASFIKRQMGKFLDAEDAAGPLSDEDLRVALGVMNIDVSRRTVAKYREAMGIPSSSKRRRR